MTEAVPVFARALQAYQAGERRRADDLCRRLLEQDPGHAEALHLLGVLYHEAGRQEEAAEWIGRALARAPANAEFHYNLGVAQQLLGRREEAAASYREAIRLQPGRAQAHNNLGHLLLGQGRPDEALDCLREALRLKPDYPEAFNNLGHVFERQGRLEEAVTYFRQAVSLLPENAGFLNDLGNVLTRLGRPDEAVACYAEAVRLCPGGSSYHSNLGNALTLTGRPAEAEASCRQALALQPHFGNAYHNLAIAQAMQGNLDQALLTNEQALRLESDHAGARNCQALWLLQRGNFEEGWREYEWRWKTPQAATRSLPQPLWDGSPLGGRRILLHAEQGLGDTIQFIRYAALVKRRGGTVIVECQAPLVRLLSRCAGIDELLARDSPLPAFDVQVPLLTLPRVFNTTPATVPADSPYLFAEDGLVQHWRQELACTEAFRVGIAWQGNPGFAGDCVRSIPLRCFAPLAAVAGVCLVSLQKGPGTEQLAEAVRLFPVIDLGGRLDEATGAFVDTAAVMKNLDLVVTSDTAIAHLAGALGVPVWVALSVGADWRYLRDREDSPWYPSMRLFRQKRFGDWAEVFERMAAELAAARTGSDLRTGQIAVAADPQAEQILHELLQVQRVDDTDRGRQVL
jgi:tetratricopeptide (TPR) repeat protein